MQIILREDVPHLGRRGDVVTVKDGYARNFLIPKGYAYRLTEGIRRQVEIESRAKAAREERERMAAERLAEKLRELGPVRFTRKGENLWAVVMEMPPGRTFTLRGVAVDPVPAASSFEVVLEATGQRLEHRVEAGELTVTLPRDIEPTAAVALRLPVGAATPSG